MKSKRKPTPDQVSCYVALPLQYFFLLSTPLLILLILVCVLFPSWLNPSSYSSVIQKSDTGFISYSKEELQVWTSKKVKITNPPSWPGENGEGYQVTEDKGTVDRHFKTHQFNVLASDRIAFNRYIGDLRHQKCLTKRYPNKLPTVTVIVSFHNEAWSTLIRTIHSVINTSPSELLHEIILVDDKSTKTYLKWQLEDYTSRLPVKVSILRQGQRSGLITGRLLAATQAKGNVLVFLDSHCECNEGWLEPLLARIVEDRTRVVSPIIDLIDDHDFAVRKSSSGLWGAFDWKVSFRWQQIPKRELERIKYDRTEPLRTPTIAGGIFAIDRRYFNHMGKYDEKMRIWGAENMEISFRIWSCGGSLEMIPCSRVGHVFRDRSPYVLLGKQDNVIHHNTGRVAKVWLEDYESFYFTLYPQALLAVGDESVTERLALKKRLACKPFRWYLKNIFPEHTLPKNFELLGQLHNAKTATCLNNLGTLGFTASPIELSRCDPNEPDSRTIYTQTFLFSEEGRISYDVLCLQPKQQSSALQLNFCNHNDESQLWSYSNVTKQITLKNTEQCLDVDESGRFYKLVINKCDTGSDNQRWTFLNNFRWRPPFLNA